jgi:class 3 adenylate cyclase
MAISSSPPYETIQRRTNGVTLGASLGGAFLTFLYFQTIEPLPLGGQAVQALGWQALVFFGMMMAVLFFIGFWAAPRVFGLRQDLLETWYVRLKRGEASPADVPSAVLRQALDFAPRSALVNFAMWGLAWLLFGPVPDLIRSMAGGTGVVSSGRMFVGIVGVGGVLTATLTYFWMDAIWRPVLPAFFPQGNLGAIPAFRLPVRRRLVIVFLLISLWPLGLLSVLSVQRAQALVTSPNPQIILDNFFFLVAFIFSVSLLVSVGLALFVTRSIVEPLGILQTAMARVEQNDFAARVPVTSNDELGYVSEGFNRMTAGLRQGELLRNLLNLYVTPEVAREAIRQGVKLGGALVECSVLFSDIRDFTGLSERLPPADLINLLNRYMSAMVAVVVEQGGMVNKFGGDSLLAVFGTPLNPADDHAARAVRAALAMRRALNEFNETQARAQGPILRIGIGLATGPVVAGNVGGESRIEYTVIGDTVNLASRLQSLTKEVGRDVLLEADTYTAASRALPLNVEHLPPVSVRGKQEPVSVYALQEG